MNVYVIKGIRKDKGKSPSVCYYSKMMQGFPVFSALLMDADMFYYYNDAQAALEKKVSRWAQFDEWNFTIIEVELKEK